MIPPLNGWTGKLSAGCPPEPASGILSDTLAMMGMVLEPKKSLAIIVCCYSGQPFFQETVDSIMRQSDKDFDIVFHDNGSHPGYSAQIDATAAQVGAAVFRSPANRYGEGLRYDVIPYIRHEFIAVIHDDDVYKPEKVRRSLVAMRERGLDYLFTARTPVDHRLSPLSRTYEAINVDPIVEEDFPHRYIAELFYKGMRLHFSTLVMRSSVARENLLGDPYIPRIADARFFAQLLLRGTLKGCVLPSPDTLVRIHGGNDFLYEKFLPARRGVEVTQLALGEFLTFQDVLSHADDILLGKVFAIFPGIPVEHGDDRVDLLAKAGMYLRPWAFGKKLMGAYCVHAGFALDPIRMMKKIRELTSEDANVEMQNLYDGYVADISANFIRTI